MFILESLWLVAGGESVAGLSGGERCRFDHLAEVFARTTAVGRPGLPTTCQQVTVYCSSFSAICGSAFAWANIAVPVCTRMLYLA